MCMQTHMLQLHLINSWVGRDVDEMPLSSCRACLPHHQVGSAPVHLAGLHSSRSSLPCPPGKLCHFPSGKPSITLPHSIGLKVPPRPHLQVLPGILAASGSSIPTPQMRPASSQPVSYLISLLSISRQALSPWT